MTSDYRLRRGLAISASRIFDVSVGLDARLVFVETHIGIQSRHADVDAGLAGDVIRVALLEFGFVEHVFRQFDYIYVVVIAS